MTLLSILDRFRPAGAPGSAGVAGVPTLDVQGPEAELAPVFAALAPDVAACAEVVDAARQASTYRLAQSREQAAAVVAQARLDADAARSRAAADVEQTASAADEAARREARDQAARLAEAGRPRVEELASRLAHSLLDAPEGEQR